MYKWKKEGRGSGGREKGEVMGGKKSEKQKHEWLKEKGENKGKLNIVYMEKEKNVRKREKLTVWSNLT